VQQVMWLIAEAAGAGGAGGGGGGGGGKPDTGSLVVNMIVPMALLFFIFYMLLIRPQKQKDKVRKEMLTRLKKKDTVTSIGGMHGQIVEITEDTVTLRVDAAKDVKVKMQRSAIAGLVKSADAEASTE